MTDTTTLQTNLIDQVRGPSTGTTLRPDVGAIAPTDPHLRSLVDDVIGALHYSYTVAAADVPNAHPGATDIVFREFLATRSEPARADHRAAARAVLAQPSPAHARLGRYANVNVADYAKVGSDGLDQLVGPVAVDGNAVRSAVEQLQLVHLAPAVIQHPIVLKKPAKKPVKLHIPKDVLDGMKYTKLRLFLKEVECIVETDEVGSDEINLGGTATTARGETHLIKEFAISHDFDEGESVLYPHPALPPLTSPDLLAAIKAAVAKANSAPGRLLAEWDIERNLGWPTAYAATIALAEKDDGGFWKFLKELARRIIAELEKAIGKSIGTVVGTAIGSVFGPLGAVVGALVGFVIGAVLDAILGDNPDDVVAVVPLTMSFGAATQSYYEWTKLLHTPHPETFPIDFVGDGGHYRLRCYYQVSTT